MDDKKTSSNRERDLVTYLHVTHPVLVFGFLARFLSPTSGDILTLYVVRRIQQFPREVDLFATKLFVLRHMQPMNSKRLWQRSAAAVCTKESID